MFILNVLLLSLHVNITNKPLSNISLHVVIYIKRYIPLRGRLAFASYVGGANRYMYGWSVG